MKSVQIRNFFGPWFSDDFWGMMSGGIEVCLLKTKFGDNPLCKHQEIAYKLFQTNINDK